MSNFTDMGRNTRPVTTAHQDQARVVLTRMLRGEELHICEYDRVTVAKIGATPISMTAIRWLIANGLIEESELRRNRNGTAFYVAKLSKKGQASFFPPKQEFEEEPEERRETAQLENSFVLVRHNDTSGIVEPIGESALLDVIIELGTEFVTEAITDKLKAKAEYHVNELGKTNKMLKKIGGIE